MNTKFLLKVLPHALAHKQTCLLADIDMPEAVAAGEDLLIPIAGMRHQIPYQIALELALDYLSKNVTHELDGYYPVAHLHREDILLHHGQYIGSQLTEEDIEHLAHNFWDDSFAESYTYTQDYLMEQYHPDLLNAPEKLIEDRLANELGVFTVYPHNFEQDFVLAFLKAEVARDSAEDQLGYLGTSLVRRFITAMQVADVVPYYINCDDILKRLDYRDYQKGFMMALRAQVEVDFGHDLPDIQSSKNQMRDSLSVPFEAGLTISQALEKLLPKIKADWDENRATQARIQAQRDYDKQRSSSMSTQLNLCDPISDKLLTVKIKGDKEGIHLRFPEVDADTEGVEHIVTLEYYNSNVQVLVHNASSQVAAQVIAIATTSS
ncbi:MAG: hypothetical protein WBC91_19820 [Phototrophicaceae bacterium]